MSLKEFNTKYPLKKFINYKGKIKMPKEDYEFYKNNYFPKNSDITLFGLEIEVI